VRVLLRHRMIGLARLEERLKALDAARQPVDRLVAWARRRAAEAGVA
jgi:hypothetical protein